MSEIKHDFLWNSILVFLNSIIVFLNYIFRSYHFWGDNHISGISEILDDIHYSHIEYNMDNMGKYLEMLEKKQEIMQEKLPSVGNFCTARPKWGKFPMITYFIKLTQTISQINSLTE